MSENELVYPIPNARKCMVLVILLLVFTILASYGWSSIKSGDLGNGIPLLVFAFFPLCGIIRVLSLWNSLWQLKIYDTYLLCRPYSVSYGTRGGGMSLFQMYFTKKYKKIYFHELKAIEYVERLYGTYHIRFWLGNSSMFNLAYIPYDHHELLSIYHVLCAKFMKLDNPNDFEPYRATYLANVVEIPLSLPNLLQTDLPEKTWRSVDFTYRRFSDDGNRIGTEKGYMYHQVIYDEISQKYFKLIMVGGYDLLDVAYFTDLSGNMFSGMISQLEYEDPACGSRSNPYLLFGLCGWNKPLLYQHPITGEEVNIDATQERFAHNTSMYFTYLISAEDFRKRFSNKDN